MDLSVEYIQLLEPGSAGQGKGPRYRVWVANLGTVDDARPFEVALVATIGDRPTSQSPCTVHRLAPIEAGGRRTIEMCLPVEVLQMDIDAQGRPVPLRKVIAGIDTGQQRAETDEQNNAMWARP